MNLVIVIKLFVLVVAFYGLRCEGSYVVINSWKNRSNSSRYILLHIRPGRTRKDLFFSFQAFLASHLSKLFVLFTKVHTWNASYGLRDSCSLRLIWQERVFN
jgi:hypothetical protein